MSTPNAPTPLPASLEQESESEQQAGGSRAGTRRRKYFTIVDAVVTHPVESGGAAIFREREVGRYEAESPYQAAKKAATKLHSRFQGIGVEAGTVYFGLREQTRNSSRKRVIRLYSAERIPLEQPHVWQRKTKDGAGNVVDVEDKCKNHETRCRAVLDGDRVRDVLEMFKRHAQRSIVPPIDPDTVVEEAGTMAQSSPSTAAVERRPGDL